MLKRMNIGRFGRMLVISLSLASISAMPIFNAAQAKDAPTLKELRAREAEDRAFQSELDYTNEVCQANFKGKIDWERMSRWDAKQSLARACDGALSAIEATCRHGKKSQVKQKISFVVCAGDGNGAQFNGTTLEYGAGPVGGAYEDVKQLLKKHIQ